MIAKVLDFSPLVIWVDSIEKAEIARTKIAMYNQRNNMSEENIIANTAPQTEQTSTVESVQQIDLDTVADSITELLGGEQEVQNNDGNDNDVATDGNDTTDVDENDTSENNESDDTPDSDADENADTEQDETQEDTDENADDEIDGFTPEQQAIFNKAQSKLRKKYQTARADRDRLQSEVESMKAQASKLEAANKNLVAEKTIVANVDVPLPHIQTTTELDAIKKQAWSVYQWAQEALNSEPQMDDDGNEYLAEAPAGDGSRQRYTKAQVRKIAQNADAIIRRDVPARRTWLEQNERFDTRLTQAFPDLKNPNSEMSIAVNSALIRFPVLKSIAGYREAALSFVLGQKLLKAHGAKSLEVIKKSVVPTKKAIAKPPVSRKPAAPAVSKKNPATPISATKTYHRSTPYSVVDDIANYFE